MLADIRRASCTNRRIVSIFLGVELVEGHPDLSSSLSDVLSLEVRVPLKTPRVTHGLISIHTSYHFKSLHARFAEFHAEFDVCSLIQFHVHAEIANMKAHVVTNTRVVQLPMLTQRCHSAYWVMTFPAPKHSARIHVLPSVGGLYGTSLETFWYTCVYSPNSMETKHWGLISQILLTHII